MGNSIPQQDLDQIPTMFDKILNISCPELDIGNECGQTGYIDFITQNRVKGAMMKGSDMYGRKFIVWKALVTIEKPSGETISFPTFTTLFKRHTDNTSLVYHTCGHYGKNLFTTLGGADLDQMNFLHNLLSTGSSEIDSTQAYAIKLAYQYEYDDEGPINTNGWIFKIKLVDSLEGL